MTSNISVLFARLILFALIISLFMTIRQIVNEKKYPLESMIVDIILSFVTFVNIFNGSLHL